MCRTSSKEWTIRGVYQTLYAIAGAKRQPHQKIHPDGALRSRARSGPPVSGAGPARAAPPTAACCCPTPRSRARPSGRGLAPPGDERAVPVSPALCFLEAVHRHDSQPQVTVPCAYGQSVGVGPSWRAPGRVRRAVHRHNRIISRKHNARASSENVGNMQGEETRRCAAYPSEVRGPGQRRPSPAPPTSPPPPLHPPTPSWPKIAGALG